MNINISHVWKEGAASLAGIGSKALVGVSILLACMFFILLIKILVDLGNEK